MPVAAVAVISRPAMMVRTHSLTPSSSAAGMENMATPTPNQPIWVKPSRKEDR